MVAATVRSTPVSSLGFAFGILASCGTPGELVPFGSGPTGSSTANDVTADAQTSTGTNATGADESADPEGTTGELPGSDEFSIVYVRCARTLEALEVSGEVVVQGVSMEASSTLRFLDTYDQFPSVRRYHGGFVAPCDLVLRDAQGDEEVLYACQDTAAATDTCAALDPAVSPDGARVAFSVFRGPIEHDEQRPANRVLHPGADPGETSVFFALPNPELAATEAQLYIVDVVSGEVSALPHAPGVFDTAPTFLADGRLVFTSTRGERAGAVVRFVDSEWTPVMPERRPPQLFIMDPAGRDVRPLTAHGLNGEFYPFQLTDGRIAHVGRQLLGMLPFRYTDGTPGQPGALSGTFQLFAIGPDGTLLTPLFGSHSHFAGGPTHTAAHRIGQSGDGLLWFTEANGISGAGSLHAFTPRMDFVAGPGPQDAPDLGALFRPRDFFIGTTWTSSSASMAPPVPMPELYVDGYADPLAYQGFTRDPDGLPGGGLVLSWVKGACSLNGDVDEVLFGDADFPQGSRGFRAANLLQALDRDTPGCDAGIYRTTVLPSEHPSDLQVIVDRARYHEIMPRAVVPYRAVHGIDHPSIDPEPTAEDPSAEIVDHGSPFGTIMLSSLLDRETSSVSGHPFASEIAWALQGTDTGDYTNDDICGLRVLAVQPNEDSDLEDLHAPAGHRLLVVGEVVAHKVDADNEPLTDASGDPDTSMHLVVPANVPLLMQAVDCVGRTLNTSQVPISVQPGEVMRCHGCHQRSSPALPLSQTAVGMDLVEATALGTGSVPLLAGGSGADVATNEHEGWGLSVEFERDVMPVFAERCLPCHDSNTAQAGLVLDVAGLDPGSTWWRLVADGLQSFVPESRQAPGPDSARLRKPQLSRYVRFMSARGSLLYWKAANARTDGREDPDHPDDAPSGFADVDFGPDHPTDLTADELAVIGRWIDTGAGAGEAFLRDTTPPTLGITVESEDPLVLTVGTVDIGSGVDRQSLRVCVFNDTASCDSVPAGMAASAGTVNIELPALDAEAEIQVEIHDLAGNTTIDRRTIGTLAGADLAEGTPTPNTDEGHMSDGGSSSGAGNSGDRSEGCGCHGGRCSPPAWWILLLFVGLGHRVSKFSRAG